MSFRTTLLRKIPLFVAGLAGIAAAHNWFIILVALFIAAVIIQDHVITRECGKDV